MSTSGPAGGAKPKSNSRPKAKPSKTAKPKRVAASREAPSSEEFGLEPPQDRMLMGWRIRSHRRANSWSLQDLSERTGLAVSTLSKMERGQTAITFDTLMKLVRGLGADLFDLLQNGSISEGDQNISVTRASEITFMESDDYRRAMLCPDYPDKKMMPMMADVRIHDIDQVEQWVQRPGEEYFHVLSGELAIHFEGRDTLILGAGDSVYFDCSIPHACVSESAEDARFIFLYWRPES